MNYIHTEDNGNGRVALYTLLDGEKNQVFLVPLSAVDPTEKTKVIVGAAKEDIKSGTIFHWTRNFVRVTDEFPVVAK